MGQVLAGTNLPGVDRNCWQKLLHVKPLNRLRLRSSANLPQKGSKIEIDPSHRNLSGFVVVFVEGAARNLNLFARRLDFGKRAFMHGFKTPFHCDQILSVGQIPNGMYIARERGDERAHKVISHGCLPFECSRRKMDYDIIGIVGENSVFIGAFPGIEILLNNARTLSGATWTAATCILTPFSTL